MAYVIEGAPKPGYRPKSQSTAFFPKVKLRLWIDKQDYQWVKVDLESLDTISFGGFLVRLARGSHVTIENARVNNEVWLPKRAKIKGSVRIALVKVMRGEIVYTFSDYKKFQTDSASLLNRRPAHLISSRLRSRIPVQQRHTLPPYQCRRIRFTACFTVRSLRS